MPIDKPDKQAQTKEAPEVLVLCGHENKHFSVSRLPNKQPVGAEQMFCTLATGHTGDHFAKYNTLRWGEVAEAEAFWSDAAG